MKSKLTFSHLWALTALIFGAGLVSISCSTQEPPQGEPIQFSTSEPSGGSDLHFEVPSGWIEENPSSAMRKAQYRLPGAEGGTGEAEVAVFAGIGGTVEQNVRRWVSQFETSDEPTIDKRVIRDFEVTIVDVSGTFSAGLMNGAAEPKSGYRMLAAVIETDGAPWFVKLVGPLDTVGKWEQSFEGFIESVR